MARRKIRLAQRSDDQIKTNASQFAEFTESASSNRKAPNATRLCANPSSTAGPTNPVGAISIGLSPQRIFATPKLQAPQRLPNYFTLLVNTNLLFTLPITAFTAVYHEAIVQVLFGGKFIEHEKPVELQPGVWLTGPVPRVHNERNWGMSSRPLRTASGTTEDNIPEDMSMVFDTVDGLVVLSGCGHAGIVNTVRSAMKAAGVDNVHAVIGGFHLGTSPKEYLQHTLQELERINPDVILPMHCTGEPFIAMLRERMPDKVVYSNVGSRFTFGA